MLIRMRAFTSIDAYIQAQDPRHQPLLRELRHTIEHSVPHAQESIAYGMPAYKVGSPLRPLAYFALAKKHLGFYPTPGPLQTHALLIKKYLHSKGAIQFPLDKKLPVTLIKKLLAARLREIQPALQKSSSHDTKKNHR